MRISLDIVLGPVLQNTCTVFVKNFMFRLVWFLRLTWAVKLDGELQNKHTRMHFSLEGRSIEKHASCFDVDAQRQTSKQNVKTL